jgi:hypothetical protein
MWTHAAPRTIVIEERALATLGTDTSRAVFIDKAPGFDSGSSGDTRASVPCLDRRGLLAQIAALSSAAEVPR